MFHGYVIVFYGTGSESTKNLSQIPHSAQLGSNGNLLGPGSPWWRDHKFPGGKMVFRGQFQQALGTSHLPIKAAQSDTRVQGRVISGRVLALSPVHMTPWVTQE